MPPVLPSQVADFVAEHRLLAPGEAVLVGVSGGVDSVVLVEVLHALGHPVGVAHVDYGLRGAASDGDAAFVAALAAERGLPHHAARRAPRAGGVSLQAAARGERYAFFAEVARAHGYGAVAVAHHRDDQAETVLLNLLRGAGPDGLAAMPPVRRLHDAAPLRLVRPLLGCSRAEIEAYARARGLAWREDASNATTDYRRNVLRHDVLPLLRRHWGPNVADRIAAAAEHQRAYLEATVRPELAARWRAGAVDGESGGALTLQVLAAAEPVWRGRLLLEALRRYLPDAPRTAATAARLEALLTAQPGRRIELAGGTVWRGRTALRFVSDAGGDEAAGADGRAVRLAPGGCVAWGGGRVCADDVVRPERLDAGSWTAYVDADRLGAPLVIRRWRAGDRLRPLGMNGTKRVSDLLTDARVPVEARAGVGVVVSGDAIVWVVGVRLAHPFRVRPETRRVVRLVFEASEKEGGGAAPLYPRPGGP